MDDLAVAFAMRCDQEGMSHEEGLEAAEALNEEIMLVAEDRPQAD